MKHKRFNLITTLILGLSLTGFSQTNFNALGGNALGSGGSISYTIGQVVYSTNNNITQGVHQPYEISTVAGLDVKSINLSISAYPNPTLDYLTLEIKEFDITNIFFQLFNINGQLIKTQRIKENHTSIDMSKFKSNTYLVRVNIGNKEIKTFKVIKN